MQSELQDASEQLHSAAADYPRLRTGVGILPDRSDSRYIYLWDQLRLGSRPERLNVLELICVQLFDGKHSLREVQAEAMRRVGGTFLPLDWFTNLVKRLDEAFFLDSPRFQAHLQSPVREPSCLGTYEPDPEALRRQISGLFSRPHGPGLPQEKRPDGALRRPLSLTLITIGEGARLRGVFARYLSGPTPPCSLLSAPHITAATALP